jgi:hypothetical protein
MTTMAPKKIYIVFSDIFERQVIDMVRTLDGPVVILSFLFNMINTVSKKRLVYIPIHL